MTLALCDVELSSGEYASLLSEQMPNNRDRDLPEPKLIPEPDGP